MVIIRASNFFTWKFFIYNLQIWLYFGL